MPLVPKENKGKDYKTFVEQKKNIKKNYPQNIKDWTWKQIKQCNKEVADLMFQGEHFGRYYQEISSRGLEKFKMQQIQEKLDRREERKKNGETIIYDYRI